MKKNVLNIMLASAAATALIAGAGLASAQTMNSEQPKASAPMKSDSEKAGQRAQTPNKDAAQTTGQAPKAEDAKKAEDGKKAPGAKSQTTGQAPEGRRYQEGAGNHRTGSARRPTASAAGSARRTTGPVRHAIRHAPGSAWSGGWPSSARRTAGPVRHAVEHAGQGGWRRPGAAQHRAADADPPDGDESGRCPARFQRLLLALCRHRGAADREIRSASVAGRGDLSRVAQLPILPRRRPDRHRGTGHSADRRGDRSVVVSEASPMCGGGSQGRPSLFWGNSEKDLPAPGILFVFNLPATRCIPEPGDRGARCLSAMPLLLGLLSYLIAAVAIVGGAATLLLSVVEPAITMVPAQQDARKVAPRIQAWLDRKVEGRAYAEKEKAAAIAEKEGAEARRMKSPATAELEAFARAHDDEKQAAERESAGRMKDKAKQETRKRSRQLRDAEPAAPLASPRSNPCNTIRTCTGEASRPPVSPWIVAPDRVAAGAALPRFLPGRPPA